MYVIGLNYATGVVLIQRFETNNPPPQIREYQVPFLFRTSVEHWKD